MSLPKVYAPIETLDIGGEQFTLRVLTRGEQYRIQKMVKAGAPDDESEIIVLACVLDAPEDEVREWYGQTPSWVVQELMEHVQRMNRLDEGAQKSGG